MENTINKKFRFREFQVYKDARKFNKELKEFSKKKFPKEEQFCLLSQLWRALDSIILNIAEGSDRGTDRDFAHFLNNSHTSLNEVVSCLDVALDNNYISEKEHLIYLGKAELLANQLTAFRQKLLIDSNRIPVKCQRSNVKGQIGFTVIELIVSMSLFVVISGIIVGSFMTSVRTQRELLSLIEARDNMSIAMEQMAREIRMGTNFEANNESGDWLKFYNLNGEQITYFFETTDLEQDYGKLMRRKNFPDAVSVFPENILIKNFKFKYFSRFGNKKIPDRVTLSFLTVPNEEKLRNNFSFNVQTTISARQF